MEVVHVEIKGVTSLLQHRFGEDAQAAQATRAQVVKTMVPRDEAEKAVYRNGDGFYFPGAAISRLLREAGAGHKMRGSRKSLKYIIPAAVVVNEDAIIIRNGDGRTPVEDYEVDARPVTIPATKGRIMRYRPRFDNWSAKLTMTIEEDVLDAAMVHQLLTEGGMRIGIGDYRPEKGGPFGRFSVVEWKPLED